MTFPKWIKLIWEKITSRKGGDVTASGTGVSIVQARENASVEQKNFIINFAQSEAEDKKIPLSSEELEILFVLSEGAELSAARDENGTVCDVHAFGTQKALDFDCNLLLKNLAPMLRKGVICQDGSLRYIISPVGQRIVQYHDRNLSGN